MKQFVQVVGAPFASWPLGPGLPGLDGARLENPDSAGELMLEYWLLTNAGGRRCPWHFLPPRVRISISNVTD